MGLRYAKLTSNRRLPDTFGVKTVYFRNVCGPEFGVSVGLAPQGVGASALSTQSVVGVADVFGRGDVFQVFHAVVGFVAVLVVNLKTLWPRSDKGVRHQAMLHEVLSKATEVSSAIPPHVMKGNFASPAHDSSARGHQVTGDQRAFRPAFQSFSPFLTCLTMPQKQALSNT